MSLMPSLNVLMCCQTCVTHEGQFIWNIMMTPSYVFGKHSQMQYPLGSTHTDGHIVTKISYWICVRFRHFMLDCFSPKRSLKRVLVIYMFLEITLCRRNNTIQNIVVTHTSTYSPCSIFLLSIPPQFLLWNYLYNSNDIWSTPHF